VAASIIHFDESRALRPLEAIAGWEKAEEAPEIFPSGI
jgi:hypothetical protein